MIVRLENTLANWRLAARSMKIRDAEGFANGFAAARQTSIEKQCECVVIRSDGSRVVYLKGEKVMLTKP